MLDSLVANGSSDVASEPQLRASSYVIYVDLPDSKDEWLLVHGYTGVYDRVSRSVAAYVRGLESSKVPKPLYGEWEPLELDKSANKPSDITIALLRQRGYLTYKTVEQELEMFEAIVLQLHQAQMRSTPTYILMPTYDCNLRCHYCFQDHMRTNPAYRRILQPMPLDIADRIMDAFSFIERQIHGIPAPKRRRITLFGGEPLLASSRAVVEHIISRQKVEGDPVFSAITNGTEIDAYEDLLGPAGISQLQITLDGPPGDHDRRRIYADGHGSFDRIADNVTMALSKGARVAVRVNVDRKNCHALPELAETFFSLRWNESPAFSAYLAPVHDYSPAGLANENAGSRGDFFNSWELGVMLDELHAAHAPSRIFSEVDGGMTSRARKLFERGGSEPQRSAFCGAHIGMYIFDAFANIYACWDRTGDDRLKIGEVHEDATVTLNGLGTMWRSRNVTSNSTCKRCRFALSCGGGCAVLAEGSSGTMFSNYCDMFGKRFRAAIARAYCTHNQ